MSDADAQMAFSYGVRFSAKGAMVFGAIQGYLVRSVEVFDDGDLLGPATLLEGRPTAGFEFIGNLSRGLHSFSAIATFEDGSSESAAAPFTLQTGVRGEPFVDVEHDFDSAGQAVGDVYTAANHKVYLEDTIAYKPTGKFVVDSASGSFFNGLNYGEMTQLYDPSGDLLQQSFYNNDGTHTIVGNADHLRLNALGYDTMTGVGKNETFFFKSRPGQEEITDFIASGPGHDVIDLPMGHLSSLAQVLHDALYQDGANTVIALGPHSSITLDNVTAETLTARDFALHGKAASMA
jgi:hypothetical protein